MPRWGGVLTASIAVIATIGLVFGMGVAATALTSEPVVHGCKGNSTGNFRVIDVDAGESCRSNETSVTWGGPSKVHTYVRWNFVSIPANGTYASLVSVQAFCADGYVSTGGGYNVTPADGNYGTVVVDSVLSPGPQGSPVNGGWAVRAFNTASIHNDLRVYVVCAAGDSSGYINDSPGEGP